MQLRNHNARVRDRRSSGRKRPAKLLLLTILVEVSDCSLARPIPHREVVHQALPATSIPPAWNQAAQPGVVGNDWLKSFNDPRLDGIVSEAIANNTDLRQAAARVEVARQNVVVVGAALMPHVNADLAGSILETDSKSGAPTS